MRHKGIFWGLVLLPVWGLAGGLLLLIALRPFFQFRKGCKAFVHHKIPLFIFLLLLVLPLFTSLNPAGHVLGFLSRYLLPVILVCAFIHYLREEGSPEDLSRALLWGGVILSVMGGGSLFLPRPFHWQGLCLPSNLATQACVLDFSLLPVFQAQSFAMNPNIFGGLLVLVLPFAWLFFEQESPLPRKTMLFMLLLLGGGILLSGSRNAWLAMGCVSIGALFSRRFLSWRGRRGVVKGALLALIISVVGAFFVAQRYSDTGRWVIWQLGLKMLQQFPWTGVGILSVEPMYQRMHTGWPQAAHLHNGLLQIMVECGIVASFSLFSYLAYRVYNQWNFALLSLHQRAALISVFLLMGMSMVDFILLDIRVMVYLSVIVACAFFPLKKQQG